MGYAARGQEGDRYRFVGDPSVPGHLLDLIHRPGGRRADFGVGSIHHIAFRVPTDEKQLAYQNAIRQAGLRVTQAMDRNYFHSIYFRERNGVLFEIATDTPGFAVDEPVHSLGESLRFDDTGIVRRIVQVNHAFPVGPFRERGENLLPHATPVVFHATPMTGFR